MAKRPRPPITVDGNTIGLVPGGTERLAQLLAMIDGAKHDIRMLFYMFTKDESGVQVRDALVEAARRGVDVSVLLDGFGCGNADPEFLAPIRDTGGDFCVFHPRVGRRYLIRNHQKLVIADGKTAIIGGANVNHQYLDDRSKDRWRDLWVSLEGPCVPKLAAYFDAVERWTKRPKARIRSLRRVIADHSEHQGTVQWKFGGPMRGRNPWSSQLTKDICAATNVDIIAAYFSPSWATLRRLISVARKKGTVRIVTAAKSDNNATIAAARFTYRKLLRGGVRMFEYRPLKLHTKLFVLDDITYVGSSNFDFRSLYLNLEMMLRIDDPRFAAMMRDYVEHEVADSTEVTWRLHAERSTLLRRTRWALSYFLVTAIDYTVTRRLNFGVE